MIYTDDNYIKNTIKKRPYDAHKGNFGKILIFSGSVGMAGAAILSARSALKSGAGLVQFLLPSFYSPLLTFFQTAVPEATCVEMSETFDLSGYDAVVTGSGLGKSMEAKKILSYIIDNYKGTLIIDADGLNMISESTVLTSHLKKSQANTIITPHIGEARRLLHSCEGIAGLESRKWAACSLAKQYNVISILKGAGTLIAKHCPSSTPEFEIFQNTTGNPGMATAGSGDSLAGIIGALAGQGYSPLDAARMGVFLHGKAGDLAAEELSEPCVTSSDIVSNIPAAFRLYYEN